MAEGDRLNPAALSSTVSCLFTISQPREAEQVAEGQRAATILAPRGLRLLPPCERYLASFAGRDGSSLPTRPMTTAAVGDDGGHCSGHSSRSSTATAAAALYVCVSAVLRKTNKIL